MNKSALADAFQTTGLAKLSERLADHFAENVFSLRVMKKMLSEKAYRSIEQTIKEGGVLDISIANEIATAMKDWAISKGATHFTHWFQPLNGLTAEKHDAFLSWDNQDHVIMNFDGKELIQGEPDASSFPSGGLRATFEARGYTGWDPTSPAFIKHGSKTSTLCIPSFYIGYHGEALDKKTPLLRSMEALNKQVCRLAKFFDIDTQGKRATCTVGLEQEYFLIDKEHFNGRPDLVQTGRTLFGRSPAKHQQLEDQYFGAIKPRIMRFMEELDEALWSLGIPAKTRHNEVAPAQYEIAPIYESFNIAIDHNMQTMEIMRQVAAKNGLVCLLHEKPFAGVNGSGKHSNWSIMGPDGKNWLHPGKTPHENAIFLTTLCAVIKAIDSYADLLRLSIASAGNDHRLGANEAPPSIMSVFLGDQLLDIVEQIEAGGAKSSSVHTEIHVGVDALPRLQKDPTDRNRTSPFAFTGNKFEFRSIGAHQNPSNPNMVLNTIVAEAISEICDNLDAEIKKGCNFTDALQKVLQETIQQHKRILFNGDNYTAEWADEAAKRGLPNLRTTLEALEVFKDKKNIALFVKHGVLSEKEVLSRYEIYKHAYHAKIDIEGNCALNLARTRLIPMALEFQLRLEGSKSLMQKKLQQTVSDLIDEALVACDKLEEALAHEDCAKISASMQGLRTHIDALEGYMPANLWPLPSYTELLLMNA